MNAPRQQKRVEGGLDCPVLPRRTWLRQQALSGASLMVWASRGLRVGAPRLALGRQDAAAESLERLDPMPWQGLALQAVDAARTAGARYADVRLTRVLQHQFLCVGSGLMLTDATRIGVGVRALVDGYWGFAAGTALTPDAVVGLARDAVATAKANAKGPPRPVAWEPIPVATGTWAMPVRIDPFTVSIEEKLANIGYWVECGNRAGFDMSSHSNMLGYIRQERLGATSEGALFMQTLYESGGSIGPKKPGGALQPPVTVFVHGLEVAATGWELFLDADIPNQFPQLEQEYEDILRPKYGSKPSTVGRYTLVCDGATMAALVGATLGVATELDRALGYEANAGGTSFLDDPLAMVGQLVVAAPEVTITANRSAPAQLATVRWDDEGVVPEPFPLISDGVLVDFLTTRESAGWLAPYYQKTHRPSRSHGCAGAEDAHAMTMQHLPNLALEPSTTALRLEDLIGDVKAGILITKGRADCDYQARTGLLIGDMRSITDGKLGRGLSGGAVRFTTEELFKQVTALGGAPTQQTRSWTQYNLPGGFPSDPKGQPPQKTSFSVRAAAATILNQPLIDPDRIA